MPFPRTWSEELIAEWLQLKGYFVEIGVPIRSGRRGGRSEADVVGVRAKDNRVEIFHIEVGSLSGNPADNAKVIRQKFSEQRHTALKEYCRKRLGVPPNRQVTYNTLYIAVWASDKTISYLKQKHLPVKRLSEFVENEVLSAIKEWKKDPPHRPQTRGKNITLPEGMWLLYLVDYLLGE